MTTYTYTNTLTVIECAACHMDFAVQNEFQRDRRSDHTRFYCPAGHVNYYPQKSDVDKARARAEHAEARATALKDQLDATERSRRALKGQVTKVRNRVSKGVCPCCNRHFENVERHMTTKHPEYAAT